MDISKKIKSVIFISVGVILFTSSALLSVDDIIVLPKTGHRKPSIVFNHKNHATYYGTKCINCHHKEKNVKCSTCHLRRDQGKVINLKGAFHQQCHDCHRRTLGPRACGRCHLKAKK